LVKVLRHLNGLTAEAIVAWVAVADGLAAKADGPPPVYGSPPVVPVTYERPYIWSNWSGFYLGINLGYGCGPNADQLALSGDFPTGVSPQGAFGGGQIGYNWQFSHLLLGVEADFQGAGVSDSVQDLNFGDNFHSRVDWFGTARGRLGYSFAQMVLYATVGFAYGNVHNRVDGPLISTYRFDGTSTGYVIGAGLEYKLSLPSWSVKSEYQYINLGINDPTEPGRRPLFQHWRRRLRHGQN